MSWDPDQNAPPPWDEAQAATPDAVAESPPPADEDALERPPADADPLLRVREERESEEIKLLREQGRAALNLLSQLVRNYQLYSADNAIFQRPLEDLHAQLCELFDRLGEVRLVVVEGQP